MRIELLVVPDCPNELPAVHRLRQVLDELGLADTVVTTRVIDEHGEAERVGFTGSPTILIAGRDPFVEAGQTPGLACRVYRTRDGVSGVPGADELRRAIAAAHSGAAAAPSDARSPDGLGSDTCQYQ